MSGLGGRSPRAAGRALALCAAAVVLVGGAPAPAMRQHEVFGAELRDAVARGDLELARSAASALEARFAFEAVPLDARWRIREVERAARTARKAEDLSEAARAVGDLAVACGTCHASVGVVVSIPDADVPTTEGLRGEMMQHDRALGRLWAGLVQPSQIPLDEGVRLFSETTIASVGRVGPAAAALDSAVNDAAAALAAAPGNERAQRFGDVLLTCATCHAGGGAGLAIEPD